LVGGEVDRGFRRKNLEMKQHPLSAAFPAMPADQFSALKDSITDIGVQDPITLYEGMVIDGWHRYTAAQEVGVECPTVELGDVDPQAFVIAKNKARRHIQQGQIALAVAAVYQWKPRGANQHGGSAPGADPAKTTAQMAGIAGVGTRTMEQAKTVESKAAPKVKEAVKSGEISVKRGAEIAQLPAKEQVKALKAPKAEAEDVHYVGPSQEEIDEAITAVKADLSTLQKLIDSDDVLADLAADNEQLRAELAVVKLSRDGYMNRSNELIERVKWLKKKLAKAEAANV
jgi:hypothetical protein